MTGKSKKIIATAVISTVLLSSIAFADTTIVPSQSSSNVSTSQSAKTSKKADPIQLLENLKAKIEEKYSQGKISQNQENNIITKINSAEQKIENFNNMTLDQKKQTLIDYFTTIVNNEVKNGKITQDKANTLIKNFTDKVNKWDGTGYPPVVMKYLKRYMGVLHENINPMNRFKKALDEAVNNNQITAQQEQDILNYLKGNKTNTSTSATTVNSEVSNNL
ncbi:hypothetical protein Tthe_1969 [Thermoanaerobacterium thermosaccharolyticum DSM 571]|uniref:Uncharacterized protein n=1 Tax=Thermoanaerobacterium thermosaccharolyticum (strain ATCC 7956 / DSM 571 / NCIMB 9385 / NCA 3814 / NCTC 13789 / WDCM 00135 / 2032) TaxID=580327 RepID=D9TLV5_THETC|nr:hypothetical protein [Thermoanaerobacterium thermosaccharolyticum]ADL69453.1 hypothetical protein Tthe_1969 [Thermoanaerobacterium thermosaccharolyticum DSM 571]